MEKIGRAANVNTVMSLNINLWPQYAVHNRSKKYRKLCINTTLVTTVSSV